MNKRHVYDYEFDLESDVAPARVFRMVRPGSRVLEVGAGPGSVTRPLVEVHGCDVVALEVDPSALEILRTVTPKVVAGDLNRAGWSRDIEAAHGRFDFVIAADVLEHVYDPWSVLEEMASLLAEGGSVILSVPHVGHASVAACLVDEDFEYWPWGLLDRTHIRFFGIKNVQALVNGAGLAIEDAQFVVRTPAMTEFAQRWERLPLDLRDALQRNRFSHVLQVVTRCRPAAGGAGGIDLMTLRPEPPDQATVEHWTRVMARQVNDRSTDLRSPLDNRPIPEPRSTAKGRISRAWRKLRKRLG